MSGLICGDSVVHHIPTLMSPNISNIPSVAPPIADRTASFAPTLLAHSTRHSSLPPSPARSSARLPVASSITSTPKLYTSPFVVALHVCQYSGATYPTVPATAVLTWLSPGPTTLASPKSVTLALPPRSSSTLLAFTSLCTTAGLHAWCRNASARPTPTATSTLLAHPNRAHSVTTSSTLPPSMKSYTSSFSGPARHHPCSSTRFGCGQTPAAAPFRTSISALNSLSPSLPILSSFLTATRLPSRSTPRYTAPHPPLPTRLASEKFPVALTMSGYVNAVLPRRNSFTPLLSESPASSHLLHLTSSSGNAGSGSGPTRDRISRNASRGRNPTAKKIPVRVRKVKNAPALALGLRRTEAAGGGVRPRFPAGTEIRGSPMNESFPNVAICPVIGTSPERRGL
ncbi:putative LRR receptor-like serine/threonine-protein kinase [Iris pallida]|uniref:LRR receptor-like serine/threonine-protein kinase n=1 Tax=Iris pallida TaxID=29817 RepID=A0AAX6H8I3_IRIPA|nr:putative LRR receptor-like serine/threonine-protein kinase [Iris pallida]